MKKDIAEEFAAELKALRKENAELHRANEILKTASAFFAAAELDRLGLAEYYAMEAYVVV